MTQEKTFQALENSLSGCMVDRFTDVFFKRTESLCNNWYGLFADLFVNLYASYQFGTVEYYCVINMQEGSWRYIRKYQISHTHYLEIQDLLYEYKESGLYGCFADLGEYGQNDHRFKGYQRKHSPGNFTLYYHFLFRVESPRFQSQPTTTTFKKHFDGSK